MDHRAFKGKSKGVTRRTIMAGAGFVAGATAAHAGHGLAADQHQETGPEDDDPRVLRYRETDHVRWFYRRARM